MGSFSKQNLRGRNFRGQDLRGANFSGADIRGANFTDAELQGADFTGTIVPSITVDLRSGKGFADALANDAIGV
jgi:Pentapeptide repeats (8 copies)